MLLDIITPDMPFIVDSALAALRAAGGSIRLFAHPVLHVAGGKVVAEGGTAVSMLHIQSDPVSDPDALVARSGRLAGHAGAGAPGQRRPQRSQAVSKG
jgi:glutamate dehydrogenase